LESEGGKHREDVGVVGGDAGGIVNGSDGTDCYWCVLCGGNGAGVVLSGKSQRAVMGEVRIGSTDLDASSDGDFS
jgi:hypothetical protein